jgi:type IV pilus assembly protein PilA
VLKHLEKRRQKNEEEGFTLIELMVVVLIMGILMAIAIPTFLSTRGSANDAAAKSNATNVFTNEKAYYSSNIQFLNATTAEEGATLDDSLPWGTGPGQVSAVVTTAPATAPTDNALVISALSKSGNCFYILDVEQSNAATIAYQVTTGNSSTCAGYTPKGTETVNTGAEPTSAYVGSGGAPAATEWYQSW